MEKKLFHFDTPRCFQLLVGTQIRVCVAASKEYYILVDWLHLDDDEPFNSLYFAVSTTSYFTPNNILCLWHFLNVQCLSFVLSLFESRYQFEFSFLIVCLLSIPLTLKVRLGVDSISIFCQFRKCVPDGITSWLFCAKLMPG